MQRDTLPFYYEQLVTKLSPEYLDSINSFEDCFNKFNYTGHIDKLNFTFLEPDHSSDELFRLSLQIYKNCIEYVFNAQGIYLIDIQSMNLHSLSELFESLTILITGNLNEINDGFNLSISHDSIEFLAESLSLLCDISIPTIMSYIDRVDSQLIEFIKLKAPINISSSPDNTYYKTRFLNFNKDNNSIVRTYVKENNQFGFKFDLALHVLLDKMHAISDDSLLIDELISLALASNLKMEFIETFIINTVDKIIPEVSRKLKLNVLISQKCKLINGENNG